MVLTRHCFVCGALARHNDAATGEPLCANHYHPFRIAPVKPEATISDEWRMLKEKLLWNYGLQLAHDKLEGRDPAWNADVAAWRGLGR